VEVAEYGEKGSGFGGYGNVILIRHNGTYSTLYAHCSQLMVSEGDEVKKGDVIALVGSTGDSTGPHCHFEIRIDGEAVDSLPYLKLENKMEKINSAAILTLYPHNSYNCNLRLNRYSHVNVGLSNILDSMGM
jgi:murein DD-endopeptidase MepM/ murein hydrolase activator NlpD